MEKSNVPIVATFNDEEFADYSSKFNRSEKSMLTLGFLFGQRNTEAKFYSFKRLYIVDQNDGIDSISLDELIAKFNRKVENYGRIDFREERVFTNKQDALDFIAQGNANDL